MADLNVLILFFAVALIFIIFLVAHICVKKDNFAECVVPADNCNCSSLNRQDCNNCKQCNYCMTSNGTGECVRGDKNGPFLKENCMAYEYMNPKFRCNLNPYISYYSYDYAPEWYDIQKHKQVFRRDEENRRHVHKMNNLHKKSHKN